MSRLKLFRIVFLICFVVPLLNCGSHHDPEENYILVSDNIQVPYWQTAKAGVWAAASQLKVRAELVGPDTFDPKAQQQAFEEALGKKPTGILISVADPALMKGEIDKAIAAGIPVIAIDSDAPESKRLLFVGTNNYEAGQLGGKRLQQELHGKGNVVVLTMPSQSNLQQRLQGYRDALAASPGIKITQVVDIKGDPRIAFDTATQMVGKERDKVDAFVCLEAQAGKEVATVLSTNGVKNKVIIAMDTDPDTLDWIRSGGIAATISQKPYTMAFVGVIMLDNLYHHKLGNLDADWGRNSFAPIPAFVDTGSSLIDRNNVEAFRQATKSATSQQK